VLEAARHDVITLVVPELVVEELVRVLTGKLGADRQAVTHYADALRSLAEIAALPAGTQPLTGDPADDAILACAIAMQTEVLVTGDRRHLLPISEHQGVRIITPQALLAELASGS